MKPLKKFDKKALVYLFVLLGLAGFVFFWRVSSEDVPGDFKVKKANYRLEDGQLDQAIKEFGLALEENPDHPYAHLGLAITYMQLDRNQEALAEFNRVIELAPDLAAAYADRGILFDRQGRYQEALADYQKALALDAEILEGPGFLWRFMRNIDEKPPAVKERAAYLAAELQKPPAERLLRVPDEDEKQRMYKIDD